MYSVWFGCETCRRSFLKLNDLFQHKEVHPLDLDKRGIQRIKQTISFQKSGNLSTLGSRKGSRKNVSQVQTQHNPFVLARRLTSQEILQNSSVLTKVCSAKYTEKAISITLPTAKRTPNNVAVFHCKLCLVKFNSDSKLTLHLNTCALSHQHRDRFCAPCNTKFHNKHNLKRHISTRHKEEKAKSKKSKDCEHCPMKFLYESDLNRHTFTHTNKNKQIRKGSSKFSQQKFQCHQRHCGKTFHLRHHLTNHLATHSDARPFTCPKPNCLLAFKTKDNLRKHIRVVHLDSQPLRYLVKNCGSSSTKEKLSPLRQHLLTHSNSGRFQCSETSCSRTFNTRGGLRYHIKTHSELRPFKCPVAGCEKSFKLKVTCRIHLMSHSEARPFACPHENCDKAYKFRDKLKRHLNSACHSHSPSLLKSTKLQPKKSSTFEIKTRPLVTNKHAVNLNSDSRSFICKQSNCRKRFPTISNLNKHLRSNHSEDSPSLEQPIRSTFEIETETNPSSKLKSTRDKVNTDLLLSSFKCNVLNCRKRFSLKGNLKRHLLTVHSEEKPFQCPVSTCEYKCKEKSSLKRHEMVHRHD